DPVMLCLERTAPVLSRGGMMILDDYNDYGGCRRATDAFLAANPSLDLVRAEPHAANRKHLPDPARAGGGGGSAPAPPQRISAYRGRQQAGEQLRPVAAFGQGHHLPR